MSNPLLLLLRLEGPLQSWGSRARWDVRDSDDEPTKSGIVGLLGCAMGIPTGDHRLQDQLDANLRLAVRIEWPGRPMIDYQTITGMLPTAGGGFKGRPGDPATIISPRTYLQDAAFLAILQGPDDLLRQSADALQKPRWPIYLGRKCCIPARPVFETITDQYRNIEHALEAHPWSCRWIEDFVQSQNRRRFPKKPPRLPDKLRCTIEDDSGNLRRYDAVRINPARMYGTRNVRIIDIDRPANPGVDEEAASCHST